MVEPPPVLVPRHKTAMSIRLHRRLCMPLCLRHYPRIYRQYRHLSHFRSIVIVQERSLINRRGLVYFGVYVAFRIWKPSNTYTDILRNIAISLFGNTAA